MTAPDFIAIGHVTLDRFGDTVRPGGAALYAAVTADRLGLSLKTVNNNTSSIFTKLNVATRTEAAILARDCGIGHP